MPSQSEKEILNQVFDEDQRHPIIDVEPDLKIEKEVEGYLEKVEKEQFLNQPINDAYGQPLISPPVPQEPKIVLPLDQNQYVLGAKQKVTESIRWLVTWCGRIIKILGARAIFRETKN